MPVNAARSIPGEQTPVPRGTAVPYRCDVQMFPGVSGETMLKKMAKWRFGEGCGGKFDNLSHSPL